MHPFMFEDTVVLIEKEEIEPTATAEVNIICASIVFSKT
jgi:hypothetical protein